MVQQKTVMAAVLTLIFGSLTFLGGASLNSTNAVYCDGDAKINGTMYHNPVMVCDRLSSTFVTCYNSKIGNGVCSSKWIKINNTLAPQQKKVLNYPCFPEPKGCDLQ